MSFHEVRFPTAISRNAQGGPERRTDIVVLACTHYPFLVNRMRKTAPWPVDWLDPAEAIAEAGGQSRFSPRSGRGLFARLLGRRAARTGAT